MKAEFSDAIDAILGHKPATLSLVVVQSLEKAKPLYPLQKTIRCLMCHLLNLLIYLKMTLLLGSKHQFSRRDDIS